MKNTYKIFTLIISTLLFFSCSDLEEDRSGIFSLDNLQSEADLVAALVPVYKRLQYSYRNPHFMRTNTLNSFIPISLKAFLKLYVREALLRVVYEPSSRN